MTEQNQEYPGSSARKVSYFCLLWPIAAYFPKNDHRTALSFRRILAWNLLIMVQLYEIKIFSRESNCFQNLIWRVQKLSDEGFLFPDLP